MKYRVINNFKSYPFEDYDKALDFQKKNGGQLYVKECECIYKK